MKREFYTPSMFEVRVANIGHPARNCSVISKESGDLSNVKDQYLLSRIRRLRVFIWLLWASGVCYPFYLTIGKGISRTYKAYSIGLLLLHILAFCYHTYTLTETNVLEDGSGLSAIGLTRHVYYAWCFMGTIGRIYACGTTLRKSFSLEILNAFVILGRLDLEGTTANRISRRTARIQVMTVSVFITMFSAFCNYLAQQSTHPLTTVSFYLQVLENLLNLTIYICGTTLIALVSFGALRSYFDVTSEEFRQAVQDRDEKLLMRAVCHHDQCLQFLDLCRKIIGLVIGFLFCICVPTLAYFCTIITQYKMYRLTWLEIVVLARWMCAALGVSTFVIICAHAVTVAAYRPKSILSRYDAPTISVSAITETFLRRFDGHTLEFSFFSLAPVSKSTLIVLLNLTATYIIVGIQITSPQC